jgi:hypothetical protein
MNTLFVRRRSSSNQANGFLRATVDQALDIMQKLIRGLRRKILIIEPRSGISMAERLSNSPETLSCKSVKEVVTELDTDVGDSNAYIRK